VNIADLTFDSESARLVVEYLAYVTAQPITVHGLVSDAALTGLLSRWADPECTVPVEDAIRAEALEPADATGPEVPLVVADDALRVRAIRAAADVAASLSWPAERLPVIYLAAVRVGLRKFAAQIRAQKGVSS
jgi:hypothetical protein